MTILKLLFFPLVMFSLSGCAAVLVGGLIYDHTESRKECQTLINDPKFSEKIKTPEYKENYNRVCGIDET